MWKRFWSSEKRMGLWKLLEVSWGSALLIRVWFMPHQENRVVRRLGIEKCMTTGTCLRAGATGTPVSFRTWA